MTNFVSDVERFLAEHKEVAQRIQEMSYVVSESRGRGEGIDHDLDRALILTRHVPDVTLFAGPSARIANSLWILCGCRFSTWCATASTFKVRLLLSTLLVC